MKFQLITLIDITNTGARKGDDERLQRQQQNYLTTTQTISLRSNPIIENKSYMKKESIKDMGFGSAYKGLQNLWFLNFEFESDSHSLNFLLKDFDLVPIITDLDESVRLDIQAFLTNDVKFKNIVFKEIR